MMHWSWSSAGRDTRACSAMALASGFMPSEIALDACEHRYAGGMHDGAISVDWLIERAWCSPYPGTDAGC